jgi:hypothetical protein
MDKRFTIVGLGEVLWDLFPEGPRFGGAPANFAGHAARLGAEAVMVSQVGDDELGTRCPPGGRCCWWPAGVRCGLSTASGVARGWCWS